MDKGLEDSGFCLHREYTTFDAYAEPRPSTPAGWAETVLAQQRGEYPNDPKGSVDNWHGEPDGQANVRLWLKNQPPKHLAEA